MDTTEIRSLCNQILTMCDYVDYMSKLHDCNDCGKKKTCIICPTAGQQTRINCHEWVEEK